MVGVKSFIIQDISDLRLQLFPSTILCMAAAPGSLSLYHRLGLVSTNGKGKRKGITLPRRTFLKRSDYT